jgi:hypothetical protein
MTMRKIIIVGAGRSSYSTNWIKDSLQPVEISSWIPPVPTGQIELTKLITEGVEHWKANPKLTEVQLGKWLKQHGRRIKAFKAPRLNKYIQLVLEQAGNV